MSNILLSTDARKKILTGAKTLADTVGLTLGPLGRNVILSRKDAQPCITNDGVTIAREVTLDDPFENLGSDILRQASLQTNHHAGDGTTSAVVLGYELLRRGSARVADGASPVLLKKGLTAASEFVTNYVSKMARPCTGYDTILAVAANSCADIDDGKLVAGALSRVGADGVVTIQESHHASAALTFVEGFECLLALASPYFALNHERLETTLTDACVLVTPHAVTSLKDLVPVLEYIAKEGMKLAIIAADFSPEAVAGLVLNKVRGGLNLVALSGAKLGDRIDAVFGDIAALTGATVLSAENDLRLADTLPHHLGTCDKIICDMASTKILADKLDKANGLSARIEQIRGQIAASTDEYTKTRLRERLARLTSGIAVITVGAPTQIETYERKLRVEDALAAATAAMRHGIVEGGGVTYIRAAQALQKHIKKMPPEHRLGAQILADSLEVILRQICINADVAPKEVIKRVSDGRLGYDALAGTFVNMFTAGIVDPAAVIKNVVENSASAVGTLLTTEGIIINNAM